MGLPKHISTCLLVTSGGMKIDNAKSGGMKSGGMKSAGMYSGAVALAIMRTIGKASQ